MASEIRTRFINYMTLQAFSPPTKKSYLDGVTGLARFHNKSPDTLTNEEVEEYFRHLLDERKVAVGTCNATVQALSAFTGTCVTGMKPDFPCRPGIVIQIRKAGGQFLEPAHFKL